MISLKIAIAWRLLILQVLLLKEAEIDTMRSASNFLFFLKTEIPTKRVSNKMFRET